MATIEYSNFSYIYSKIVNFFTFLSVYRIIAINIDKPKNSSFYSQMH